MRCIILVSYKVVLNGQPRGNIVPHKGFQHGDLLSFFIFILRTEALIGLFNHAENQGTIMGCVHHALVLRFHTFFADDSLFFYKVEPHKWPHKCKEVMKAIRMHT